MGFEIIVFAVLAVAMNVMDSITTSLCLKQYPDKGMTGESNPIMKHLMIKNRVLAEIVKQGLVLGIVGWYLWIGNIKGVRMIFLLFALVVFNNTWVFVSRALTKRKVRGLFKLLQDILYIPNWVMYPVALFVIGVLATTIYWAVWG